MRLSEVSSWVPAYRASAFDLDVTFGAFFAPSERMARGYGDKVVAYEIDMSRSLRWTAETSAEFQEYVIECRRRGKSPAGVRVALARYNRLNGSDLSLAEAIGQLLGERASRLGHHEIDPLAGYVRGFIKERGVDVVVRDHESGGGMMDGIEYIVFSSKRVRPMVTEDVWHGTDRHFRRFAAKYIGTGQGQSKHGWGFYFAADSSTARRYAKLSDDGHVVGATIPDRGYLDWDAPLADQPVLTRLYDAVPEPDRLRYFVDHGWRGLDAYRWLERELGSKKAASLALSKAGIVGITYLGRDALDGQGVRNYVVFDTKNVGKLNYSDPTVV